MAFNPLIPKKTGQTLAERIAAAKEAAQKMDALSTKEPEIVWNSAELATDRIGIIFDDSASMDGDFIRDAKEGTIEFMRNCTPNQTAIGIFRMNNDAIDFTTDLPRLSMQVKEFNADGGGTPMFKTARRAFNSKIKATRLIIFSDGIANVSFYGEDNKDTIITTAIENKQKIDTCFFGTKTYPNTAPNPGYELLKEIADRTGGICLCFDTDKVDFKKAFKYLTPGRRLFLTQGNNIAKLEAGELV